MKNKIFGLLVCLLLLCSTALASGLTKLGDTAGGAMYMNTEAVQPLRKDGELFLLVQLEEHYTNKDFLARLRASKPQLQKVTAASYLYMFTNKGTHYCLPQRLLLNQDETVAYDLGQDMKLQPVKSRILVRAYENALQILERKQRIANMYK